MKGIVPDLSKLQPLCGSNYRRWSEELLFFFQETGIDYVLTEDAEIVSDDVNSESVNIQAKMDSSKVVQDATKKQRRDGSYEEHNRTCRGHIIRHLSEKLFDIYVSYDSAKEIWSNLKKKYGGEDEGKKQYVTSQWTCFKIQDNEPMLDQLHDYEAIVSRIQAERMPIDDHLAALVLIDKLPESWGNYISKLKHEKRKMSLNELISDIMIEEANRSYQGMDSKASSYNSNANLVESSLGNKKKNCKEKKDCGENKNQLKQTVEFKKKLKCWNCGKLGHRKFECKLPLKKKNESQAHLTEDIVAVVTEAFAATDKVEWIIDSGSTRHICNQKSLFKRLEDNGSNTVYLGDARGLKVEGIGEVELIMSSGRTLTLTKALFVPDMRRNLISSALLMNAGVKQTIDSGMLILSKSGNYVDIANFKNTTSRGGKSYYITFIDDYSKFSRVYLLRSKDEAFDTFLQYKNEVEKQLDRKIKRIRSDRGGEYMSEKFNRFCVDEGIVHETSAPYTPQQNGTAERKNRTLKNMMNAMLLDSGLSDQMWGEAVLTACYILNRVPHKKTKATPYEMWKGYAPNLSYLRSWGCLVKVGLPDFKRSNIGSKTQDAVFIGYAQNSAAYRCIVFEKGSMKLGHVVESRDMEFFEENFPFKRTEKQAEHLPSTFSSNIDKDTSLTGKRSAEISKETELRKSKRIRTTTDFGAEFITSFLVEEDELNEEIVYTFLLDDEPLSFSEAMRSIDAFFWKEAADDEYDSIITNHTWELVDLPSGCKALKSKWVLRKKLKPDGSIDKFKARLVVRGYSQKYGIDFFDTYAPVTKIASIRMLLAFASSHRMIVHQMDVKTAFLNGDLDEEIYMMQPEGYVQKGQENKVCRLKKSLYGLKQAPKKWFEKFSSVLKEKEFVTNSGDTCIFSKGNEGEYVIICLYVDDMLILGSNPMVVEETKSFLCSKFSMKDLGEVDVILGIKVTKTEEGFSLSQGHYVEKVLKRFGYWDKSAVRTPYDSSLHLCKNKGESVRQNEYAKMLGSVMYLMNCTRPDIAYAVSRLSRYTHNPNDDHWKAMDRLMRYLKGTINWSIKYRGSACVIEGFCDANWVTDNDEINSTSGYVFTLGGGAISWRSRKQTCIARSTMEAELIALELAAQEADWLRNVYMDLPMVSKLCTSILIRCDSQAAIGVAMNGLYNGKKRHIRMRHKVLRGLMEAGVLSIEFVRSAKNIADPFTKALCGRLVKETAEEMGLSCT